MNALFIGSYPNAVEPYRSAFFQTLIHQFAAMGISCTVISCVSVTHYKNKILDIPTYEKEMTPDGNIIEVYRPRYISYSAKKIASWNTFSLTKRSYDAAALAQVKKIQTRFDFAYGHFFLNGGLTAAKIGQEFNIPAYIAYGECDFKSEVSSKYPKITLEEMRGVHGIISVSSANSLELKEQGLVDNIPILLSLNSVNKNIFKIKSKHICREKFGMPENDFIVGFVGYFIDRKGPLRVLEACSGLHDVKLAFAGKGSQKPTGDNVIFCQSLQHHEVSDFLNAVDVFILPTLNEGCCNAVVEAMSCGKAIISSDLSFNSDILNSNNSILIDPNNIEEIKRAIIELRDNVEKRKELADQAYFDAEKLSIENRAKNILKFIIETI